MSNIHIDIISRLQKDNLKLTQRIIELEEIESNIEHERLRLLHLNLSFKNEIDSLKSHIKTLEAPCMICPYSDEDCIGPNPCNGCLDDIDREGW